MAFVFDNVTYNVGSTGGVVVDATTATVAFLLDSAAVLNGTINVVGDTLIMTISATPFTLTATNLDNPDAIVFFSSELGFSVLFSNAPIIAGQVFNFGDTALDDYIVPCFASGTRILTRRGEVAVEDLAVGDAAVALLAGGFAPISWIGRREVDCTKARHPSSLWPLRVRAKAFGPGRPHRDLLLSPDHAVYVEGGLIPIRYLENGTTIAREPMDAVTYFHIELTRHDVLLAEGLASESYLDTGNRADFLGVARDRALVVADEFAAREVWAQQACAPIHVAGPVVEAARRRIAAQADALGVVADNDPQLRLRIAGRDLLPVRDGEGWRFDVAEPMAGGRLLSRCFVPAFSLPDTIDQRCLGVAVTRLVVDGADLPLDALSLLRGWHPAETGLRWTSGAAEVPAFRSLVVHVAELRWQMPQGLVTRAA